MTGTPTSAWRNRLISAAVVGSLAAGLALLVRDPAARTDARYLTVAMVGYGHLLGAVVFGRRRLAALRPAWLPPPLAAVWTGLTLLTLLAAYTTVQAQAGAFLALLVVSAWHNLENDLALAKAYRRDLRLGPRWRDADHQLATAALTALFIRVSVASLGPVHGSALSPDLLGLPEGGDVDRLVVLATALVGLVALAGAKRFPVKLLGLLCAGAALLLPADVSAWLGIADVFFVSALYHQVSFLVLADDRAHLAGVPGERGRLWRRLALVHAPGAILGAILLLAPRGALGDALRLCCFTPQIFLFWSVLHVLQTAAVRSGRRGAMPGPRSHAYERS